MCTQALVPRLPIKPMCSDFLLDCSLGLGNLLEMPLVEKCWKRTHTHNEAHQQKNNKKTRSLSAKATTHSYIFQNMLDTTVRVLLEEDPEGMLQARDVSGLEWLTTHYGMLVIWDIDNHLTWMAKWQHWISLDILFAISSAEGFCSPVSYFLNIPGLFYMFLEGAFFHLKGELELIFQWHMFVLN